MLTLQQAVYLVREACEALHYAHERYDMTGQTIEVVHGQFSADNLLVDMEGKIKIVDFGSLGTRNATVTNVAVPARLQRRMAYMALNCRAQIQMVICPTLTAPPISTAWARFCGNCFRVRRCRCRKTTIRRRSRDKAQHPGCSLPKWC